MKSISIIVTAMCFIILTCTLEPASHIQGQASSIFSFADFFTFNHPAQNFVHPQLEQPQQQEDSGSYDPSLDPNNIITSFFEDPKSIPTSQQLCNQHRLTDPYQKLYLFALSDPQIKTALESKQQLTEEQETKIAEYMVNNKYFQQDILKQLLKKKENSWLKDLSKDSQLKYIRIIGVLSTKDIQNSTLLEEVKTRVLAQKELGQALSDFLTQNPTINPISIDNLVITSNYL